VLSLRCRVFFLIHTVGWNVSEKRHRQILTFLTACGVWTGRGGGGRCSHVQHVQLGKTLLLSVLDTVINASDASEKIMKVMNDIQDLVCKVYKPCFQAKIDWVVKFGKSELFTGLHLCFMHVNLSITCNKNLFLLALLNIQCCHINTVILNTTGKSTLKKFKIWNYIVRSTNFWSQELWRKEGFAVVY
jgi:hypothetical protein